MSEAKADCLIQKKKKRKKTEKALQLIIWLCKK
jgi:hypothetical protein